MTTNHTTIDLPDKIYGLNLEIYFVLSCFGVITVLTICFTTLKILWTMFKLYVMARLLPGIDFKKVGEWVVVTGATDGIGYHFAKAFARRGMKIVLISRTQEKLDKVKAELTSLYNIEVKTIQADMSKREVYMEISYELCDLDVAVLVNNVGMAQSKMGKFLDTPNLRDLIPMMLNTNCLPISLMTATVLPKMLEKSRGVIVNVTSISAETGFTSAPLYSATKTFIAHLSNLLQRSYMRWNSGVIIQTMAPGPITTKMLAGFSRKQERKVTGLFNVDPENFVASAIKTIGWTDYCHGHILHYILSISTSIMPVFLTDYLTARG